MDFGRLKIDEVFTYNDKFYKVVPDRQVVFPCAFCAFNNMPCYIFQCKAGERIDGQGVEFVECNQQGELLNKPFVLTDTIKEVIKDLEVGKKDFNRYVFSHELPPELVVKITNALKKYARACVEASLKRAEENAKSRPLTHQDNIVLL